jgi:BirA family biotin operon repressor/biotin-[acetyl-CoA-carboxylase] ligase
MSQNPERDLLQRLLAGPVSGDALARETGQSRAAVWKRVEALRAAGVAIEARAGRGYALAQPLDLLDPADILAAMPAELRAGIARLDVRWSVVSTNSELAALAPSPGATVLLAERQTGGRGRRGRTWASPLAANLYLSVARGFEGGLARLGGLSLVAGVAVVEALHGLGAGDVRLKWPNDIVVAGQGVPRKLGGVLVEGGGEHAGPARAVIGIGLNVRMPAAAAHAIDQPWTDLHAQLGDGLPVRNTIAAAVLSRLLPALSRFDREGLSPFLQDYARHDLLLGREVTVHAHDGEHAGIALGIAADGALRVRFADGERNVHSGEVSVRGGT